MTKAAILPLLHLFLLLGTAMPCARASETVGPACGTLVIVGGGDRDYVNFRHFVKLAGGQEAKLVVVPTAASTEANYDYANHRTARYAREQLGMEHVTVVHTHDPREADTAAFVEPLRAADAVWFTGGRQWRIADAYLGTRTQRALERVLERGGVIGGSSAGASIQASFLVRGDTGGNATLIGDHQQGLGYLKHSAIDQHVIPRKRELDLIEVLSDPQGKMDPAFDRRSLLGIGIDEGTAIVVRRNVFEVVGKDRGVVLVYDPTRWTAETPDEEKMLVLNKGARYDLQCRMVLPPSPPAPCRRPLRQFGRTRRLRNR